MPPHKCPSAGHGNAHAAHCAHAAFSFTRDILFRVRTRLGLLKAESALCIAGVLAWQEADRRYAMKWHKNQAMAALINSRCIRHDAIITLLACGDSRCRSHRGIFYIERSGIVIDDNVAKISTDLKCLMIIIGAARPYERRRQPTVIETDAFAAPTGRMMVRHHGRLSPRKLGVIACRCLVMENDIKSPRAIVATVFKIVLAEKMPRQRVILVTAYDGDVDINL